MKYEIGEIMDGFRIISRTRNGKLLLECSKCGATYEKHYPQSGHHYKCECMKKKPPQYRAYLLITYKGKTQNATEWAKETGICRDTISKRFHAGLSPEKIFEPTRKQTTICEYCGKEFLPTRTGGKYCCYECSVNARYGEEQRRAYHNFKGSNRIYRNGKPDRSISLTKLYMRDMGVCALCGRHIDFDCDSNINDYPTIDHITPLSKGGLHTWDNVQLACRGCNLRKSDK